jgi:hypothetical protein
VNKAGKAAEFHTYPRGLQALRIGLTLIPEDIPSGGENKGGRKPGKVGFKKGGYPGVEALFHRDEILVAKPFHVGSG